LELESIALEFIASADETAPPTIAAAALNVKMKMIMITE
jgi:hypothetical protein